MAAALHSDTANLLKDYQDGTWVPTPAEQELASALARAHWDEHLLPTALRDVPQALRSGRLIDVLAPAADHFSAAGPHGLAPQLRLLIDALADREDR